MRPSRVTASASTRMVATCSHCPSMVTGPSPASSMTMLGVVTVTESLYLPVCSSSASPGMASAKAFARACRPGNTSICRCVCAETERAGAAASNPVRASTTTATRGVATASLPSRNHLGMPMGLKRIRSTASPRLDTGPTQKNGVMDVLLRTDRLVLRRFSEAEAEHLADLDSDPEVMRFLTGGAATPRDTIEKEVLPGWLEEYRRSPGFGHWAAVE